MPAPCMPWMHPVNRHGNVSATNASVQYGNRPPWMNAQNDRKDAIASQQPCPHASTQQQLAAVGITSQTDEKPSANSSRSSLTPQPKWMTLELEERGWRRIVQNFTPSWVSYFPVSFPLW